MVIFRLYFDPFMILVFHFASLLFLLFSLPLCLWYQVGHSLVITSALEKVLALSFSLELDFVVNFVVQLDLMTLLFPLQVLLILKTLVPPTLLELACNHLKFSSLALQLIQCYYDV